MRVAFMRAEIIATGSELLFGNMLETNSLFLSEELMLIGIDPAFKTVVGDNERDMEESLRRALDRVDVIIITGGIGPTEDDMTRKVVSKVMKKRLALNEDALKTIRERFATRGREYINANDRQALIPVGARLIQNSLGTAPGFFIDKEGPFIAVLPGVPREMKAMFNEELRPVLAERFGGRIYIRRRILRTCGMFESAINQTLENILKREQPVIGLSAKETGVDIRIIARSTSDEQSQSMIVKTEAEIRELLGDTIYGVDEREIEEIVGVLLKQRRLKLSIAESCTAGLICKRITSIAGSSEYFERGAVVYSDLAKIEMLDISRRLLERHGAVSAEIAAAMAQGIRTKSHTDLGLSVTGIAGPDGGTEKKPVGLVYTALASSEGVKTNEHRFLGGREQIRVRASQMALDMVRRHLIE
jgi:nicotinamide-nucleotide amidase